MAARVALLYALLAGLWIVLSDQALLWLDLAPRTLVQLQTYKGGFFVAVSGLALLMLLRRELHHREQMGEELQQTARRLQALVQAAPVAIFVLDLAGKVVMWSPAAERLFGWKQDEVLGRLLPIMPEDKLDVFQAWRERVLRGEVSTGVEIRVRQKDGSVLEASVSAAVLGGKEGGYTGILAVLEDITERKRRDVQQQILHRLREEVWKMGTEEDIGNVLVKVSEGLAGLGIPFSVCDLNLVDCTQQPPVIGHHKVAGPEAWRDAEVASGEAMEALLRIWQGGQPVYRRDLEQEDVFGERDAIQAMFGLSARSVLDVPFSHGILAVNSTQPEAFSVRDITFIQELAATLGEGFRRLDDLKEMVRKEQQLQRAQRMEAVGRLVGGVAHDFNNLLTILLGYGQFFLHDLGAEDPHREYVQQMQEAAGRAATLVRQLLAFSRRQVLQPQVLNLNALVADVGQLLRRLLGEDIELCLGLDAELGQVTVDPAQLEQVVMNLAVNARDAMPAGGQLIIETSNVELSGDGFGTPGSVEVRPGPYVMLAVSDTGIGMDAETQAHIFEPFFTTKDSEKGTGLGLATVYGIVKQSDGYIWVYSEPGQGTTFKIYLPRVDKVAQPRERALAAGPIPHGSGTILLVEDEAMVRNLVGRVLREHGYAVLEAARGEEGLRLGQEHPGPIHLLVTDVILTGINGRALAEQLAAVRPEMRVLYISGYTDSAVAHHGVLAPGTAFLPKPFLPDQLRRKVYETMNRSGEDGRL
jgi:PAS domain S-box-containing protein